MVFHPDFVVCLMVGLEGIPLQGLTPFQLYVGGPCVRAGGVDPLQAVGFRVARPGERPPQDYTECAWPAPMANI